MNVQKVQMSQCKGLCMSTYHILRMCAHSLDGGNHGTIIVLTVNASHNGTAMWTTVV